MFAFGVFTQVSDSGPQGPLVYVMGKALSGELSCPCDGSCFIIQQCIKKKVRMADSEQPDRTAKGEVSSKSALFGHVYLSA